MAYKALCCALCVGTLFLRFYARNIEYMYEKEITKRITLHVLKSQAWSGEKSNKIIPSVLKLGRKAEF
jgi:hypothetical protein